MRLYILLLFPIMLISKFSYAATSPEVTELLNSAKQFYKNKNYTDTVSLYEEAIKLGSPKARLYLSSMYRSGKGVGKNESKAKEYIDEAITIYKNRAKDNDADAQYRLGGIYKYRIKPAKKVESHKWFLLAANNNHMKAQYMVAGTLDLGFGEPEIKRDFKEAVKWYEKSAGQGNSAAAFKLVYKNRGDFDYILKWCMPVAKQQNDRWHSKCLEAINLIVGRKINSKKYKQKSIDAIHELANSNIVMSQVALAHMYKEGKIVTKNIKEVKKWSNKAFATALSKAQSGDKQAQYELSLLYEKGIGTDIYIDQSKVWLSKSVKQGYKPAIKKSAILNKQ